jgi:hypothetical protein
VGLPCLSIPTRCAGGYGEGGRTRNISKAGYAPGRAVPREGRRTQREMSLEVMDMARPWEVQPAWKRMSEPYCASAEAK